MGSSVETGPSGSAWKQVGLAPHHGIALPLASIRRPHSFGIGEYLDLIPLIEWCAHIGFNVIQLLPLNDSGADPSPYSALSATALHPIYLSIKALPYINEYPELVAELTAATHPTHHERKRVAYAEVLSAKERFFQRYLALTAPRIERLDAFQTFLRKSPWLDAYVLYKVLKDHEEGRPWFLWRHEWQHTDPAQAASLSAHFRKECDHHRYIQFLAFSQLHEVKETADRHQVRLKGDIPILINRDSADVWYDRAYFLLPFAAGAPPDMYSEEGQYWGFPPYNWPLLEKDGYGWWTRRLQTAESLYHLYRLDHVVGFYRIWAIPLSKKAKEGFFLPADETTWIPHGELILRHLLASSCMLPIGEDLGIVPDSVRANLTKLGIPGTKVMRWERRWGKDNSFIPPSEYPALSLACVSTHDSETLGEWWVNAPYEARRFASELGIPYTHDLSHKTRFSILAACHTSASLFRINLIQEYLSLVPDLSWKHPHDDRINIPGQVLERNWTWRMRASLDDIICSKELTQYMTALAQS